MHSSNLVQSHTYTRWLGPTPGTIILAVSPCGANQYQRWKAGEEHRGKVSESSVLTPALSWDSWIPTENSCKGHTAVLHNIIKQQMSFSSLSYVNTAIMTLVSVVHVLL